MVSSSRSYWKGIEDCDLWCSVCLCICHNHQLKVLPNTWTKVWFEIQEKKRKPLFSNTINFSMQQRDDWVPENEPMACTWWFLTALRFFAVKLFLSLRVRFQGIHFLIHYVTSHCSRVTFLPTMTYRVILKQWGWFQEETRLLIPFCTSIRIEYEKQKWPTYAVVK